MPENASGGSSSSSSLLIRSKNPRRCQAENPLKLLSEFAGPALGKPGTGKSHIAKAIAYQAILQSHKVQYLETDDFFHRYALNSPAQREVRLRTIIDCDLLVLDDLFLARAIPDDAGTLLQTLIHQRYKLRRSVIVTSNRVVQDWGAYLGDNTMSTTILDRLMHHCHLLEFDGRSYRLKEAAEALARETNSN
ncbi:DNA replication protein DnaC [Bradyrhizobium japonicum]